MPSAFSVHVLERGQDASVSILGHKNNDFVRQVQDFYIAKNARHFSISTVKKIVVMSFYWLFSPEVSVTASFSLFL
jgi:hypothetical protein